MFGKPDPKKIDKMMKRLNINTKQIEASQVVIKTPSKDIVIREPEVMIMNMMGRDVFQITGKIEEGTNEDDIKMVMEHTGKDRETVEKKMKEFDNDIAKVIMELKKEDEA